MTNGEVEIIPPARHQQIVAGEQAGDKESVRAWFQEMFNQLQSMASELGLEELTQASHLVDDAYRRVWPPQVVRLSTHRGPGERERIISMLGWQEQEQ